MRVNFGVLEQHAEEAAFLWTLRDAAVDAPHYTLDHLARLDERVDAHVDGLRVAGDAAWEICKEALGREEAGEVFAAAIVAIETKNPDYLETVRRTARSPNLVRGLEGAFRWLGDDRGAGPPRTFRSRRETDPARSKIVRAGEIGDPTAAPDLIERMNHPPLTRLAGEAFEMITGKEFQGAKPAGFEPGPTENPEDENVEMDPDEHLPWPNPEKVRDWWEKHASEFRVGTKYLLGKPRETAWLNEVLRTGRQRQRATAALELANRQPDRSMFDVQAPAFRQRRLLGIISS